MNRGKYMQGIKMERFKIQSEEEEVVEMFENYIKKINGEIMSINMIEKDIETKSGKMEKEIRYTVIYKEK